MKWICIVCEKEIPFDHNCPGDDREGILPCIEGGTFEINFGWFSRFDKLEEAFTERDIRRQGCVCDDCFEKKQHLIRTIEVVTNKSFKNVNKR